MQTNKNPEKQLWAQLLTQPLNEQQLAEYESLFSSQGFADMVRQYHTDGALKTLREIILNYFKDGALLEAMITAIENVWLDCVGRVEPNLSISVQENWRDQPHLLSQVLLQHAIETISDRKNNINLDIAPELEEMQKQWQARLPKPIQGLSSESQEMIETLSEHTVFLYDALTTVRKSIESKGLKLDDKDYVEVWTMILLQTYLSNHPEMPDFYLLLDSNWNLYLERLSDLIQLMCLMEGLEKFLLPQNHSLLESYMQGQEFQDKLLRLMD